MQQKISIFIVILLVTAGGAACSRLGRSRLPVMQLDVEIVAPPANREAATKETIEIIESRLNAVGVTADVKSQGVPSDGRIVVNLWKVPDVERVKKIISESGKLELAHVVSNASPAPCQSYPTKEAAIASTNKGGNIPADRRVLPFPQRPEIVSAGSETPVPNKWLIVESPAIIDGTELRTASAIPSSIGISDDYQIAFSLKKTGAEKLGSWTAANINQYIAVVLNDEVRSVAFIRSQIFDTGEISGRFTKQSAEDLAIVLKSGSLPFPVRIVGQSFIQQK